MKHWLLFCAVSLLLALAPVGRMHAATVEQKLSPATVIREVAAVYRERNPHVVTLQRTITDSTPNQPMYFVELRGHFHRGKLQARYLLFSALAQRWYVWGVVAQDARYHTVWSVDVLPHPKKGQ